MMWFVAVSALFSSAFGADLQTTLETAKPYRAARFAKGAPAIPDSAYKAAMAGEVQTGMVTVPGHGAKKIWSVGVVDVPIARFWSAINDDRNKTKNTKLTHNIVLSGQPCGSERKVFQYLPVTMLTDRWWVVTQKTNDGLMSKSGGKVREMFWKNLPDMPSHLNDKALAVTNAGGMHIEFTEGSWFLVDMGDQTLVEYYTWSDPGGNVPAGMASSLSSRSLASTMATYTTAAKGSPSCPIQ